MNKKNQRSSDQTHDLTNFKDYFTKKSYDVNDFKVTDVLKRFKIS